MSMIEFPKNFIWGAATAAYQIEGSAYDDGKGLSIWDRFTHQKGKITDGTNGNTVADHYKRYEEDVELMTKLNLKSYRFSISWPRVLADGIHQSNTKGLDFYSRLTDLLLEKGIKPFPTLYHWDLPLNLQDKGGWLNRDTAKYFADYCDFTVSKLGDRIQEWTTLNEPFMFWSMGFVTGEHAPGIKSIPKAFKAAHHILLAHGMGLEALRNQSSDFKVGLVNALAPPYPLTLKDKKAALKAEDFFIYLFMDPVFKGKFPSRLRKWIRFFNREFREEDLKLISQPIDFLGVNHYTRLMVRRSLSPVGFKLEDPRTGIPRTDMGWEIYPKAFERLLKFIRKEYRNPPIYITENGIALADRMINGTVHDPERIEYLKLYLKALKKSIDKGSNIKGYFVWSLMDNFEWSYGLSKRFGLIYVDYQNQQKRTIKDSGYWYADLCQNNRYEF